MATGGFTPNATADFLEEWKAKREKMRARMMGDIAAAAASTPSAVPTVATPLTSNNNRLEPAATEIINKANNGPADGGHARRAVAAPTERCSGSDGESPVPPPCAGTGTGTASGTGKGREKKSAGPSARKGKGQIEKRKLREKRRSTGVVRIPSNESLDELDDDEGGEKDHMFEESLTQHNTFQNETMTSDPGTVHILQESVRSAAGRYKSVAGCEKEAGVRYRQEQSRHSRDTNNLERRIEELEKELLRERQENALLLAAQKDKEEVILKMRDQRDLLYRELDELEDENEQLKEENKTLLKVVGQLTR